MIFLSVVFGWFDKSNRTSGGLRSHGGDTEYLRKGQKIISPGEGELEF